VNEIILACIVRAGSNINLRYFLFFPIFLFSITTNAELDSPQKIVSLSNDFAVRIEVLNDFIASYDFKCPSTLTEAQLISLLNDENEDHELSVMIESDRLSWRDIYLEARSGISCLTQGAVSKGY
jgi:hypothetical protein